jgi:hypothetical protein
VGRVLTMKRITVKYAQERIEYYTKIKNARQLRHWKVELTQAQLREPVVPSKEEGSK